MPKIQAVQLSEVMGSLPRIEQFGELRSSVAISLLICALGFEERGLAFPRTLADGGLTASRSVYFEFSTNRPDNETNRAELARHLNRISKRVESVDADDDLFAEVFRKLIRSVVEATPTCESWIFFDISVVSNRMLMKAMKVLLEFDVRLTLLYSEAEVYFPTRAQYESAISSSAQGEAPWLDRGVSEIIVSQEYPGFHVDQQPDFLIVIPGFNRDRVLAIIRRVDPAYATLVESNILWLIGVPHLAEDCWRVNFMREVHGLTDDVVQCELSTFDYQEALRVLESAYQERVDQFRFTVSPLGSKLQSLACSLFCYMHPDVRVMFSAPAEYNASHFSKGCREMWTIDCESLKKIRATLDQVGVLRIED